MFWKTIPELIELSADLSRFERRLNGLADQLGLNLAACQCDHIALRCHQATTAQRWFDGWRQCGRLLQASEINGRAIALFHVPDAIELGGLSIDCVELPWPGTRRYPHEGWEHIEIVLPGPAETLAQRVLSLLGDAALSSPAIKITQSAPQNPNDVLPNPTFAITDGRATIKFHPHSLRAVAADGRPS